MVTTEEPARVAVLGRIPGIVGMGAIGPALARRARAFDMEVVYHSRRAVAVGKVAAILAGDPPLTPVG